MEFSFDLSTDNHNAHLEKGFKKGLAKRPSHPGTKTKVVFSVGRRPEKRSWDLKDPTARFTLSHSGFVSRGLSSPEENGDS